MFQSTAVDIVSIKEEFQQYLQATHPGNPEISILEYWKAAIRKYPHLCKAALNFLYVCIGSVDGERSFSKLRTVQELDQCSMSEETLYICGSTREDSWPYLFSNVYK